MKNNFSTIQTSRADTPLISVALPVYNGEDYLAEAIDSILAQTFTNFELIIIDDGSTDNSLAILRRYQALDDRVVLVSRENRNLVNTLNEAIDLARGVWLARMDQDDIAFPYRFERQLEWLAHTGADICGSWVKFFGGGNHHTWRAYESDEAIKMDMLFKSPFAHPSVMMRADLVRNLRYDKSCEKAEDYDLWIRAAQAGWKMTNVPVVLLMYRCHASQITSKSSHGQQSMSAEIKKRYWTYITELNALEAASARHALNFVLLNTGMNVKIEMANFTFGRLLKLNNDVARQALVDNISWVYLKNACNYPEARERWGDLSSKFTTERAFGMSFKLWLLTIIKVQRGCRIFNYFKKMYYYFYR